jgi:aspartate carbamoyltransferase regulatory subunit
MKELKVQPIRNGTVIDHIESGMALNVLKILGITSDNIRSTISVAMHVRSKKGEWKDIVKIEDRELFAREVDRIALISPRATINIIRDYNVAEKRKVKIPPVIRGIVRCANPNCITNSNEPVETEFSVIREFPLTLKCHFCDRTQSRVEEYII